MVATVRNVNLKIEKKKSLGHKSKPKFNLNLLFNQKLSIAHDRTKLKCASQVLKIEIIKLLLSSKINQNAMF